MELLNFCLVLAGTGVILAYWIDLKAQQAASEEACEELEDTLEEQYQEFKGVLRDFADEAQMWQDALDNIPTRF